MKIFDVESPAHRDAVLDSFKLSEFSLNLTFPEEYDSHRFTINRIFWTFKENFEEYPESHEEFLISLSMKDYTEETEKEIDRSFFEKAVKIYFAFYLTFLSLYLMEDEGVGNVDNTAYEIENIFDNIVFSDAKEMKVCEYVKRYEFS